MRVLDLTSNSSMSALDETVATSIHSGGTCVFVVAPGSIDLPKWLKEHRAEKEKEKRDSNTKSAPIWVLDTNDAAGGLSLHVRHRWWPHLSMEDPPWEHMEANALLSFGAMKRALSLVAWRVRST